MKNAWAVGTITDEFLTTSSNWVLRILFTMEDLAKLTGLEGEEHMKNIRKLLIPLSQMG